MTDNKSYTIICAIDIGTTHSGYARSLKSAPDLIYLNKNWGDLDGGYESYKTATSVLVSSKNEFVDFGSSAESIYYHCRLKPNASGAPVHHLFKNFKMLLHQKSDIARDTKVVAEDGHVLDALTIFKYTLGFFKEHLINSLRLRPDVTVPKIKWVVTVPAIWRPVAKAVMRESAFQAGLITTIDSNALVLALEPEVASFVCRRMRADEFHACAALPPEVDSLQFKRGTQYLTVDCGGGTCDITTHELVGRGGKVREIHFAVGGAAGGRDVNTQFENVISKLFGNNTIEKFKRSMPQLWHNFMCRFENVKKHMANDEESSIAIDVPWPFHEKENAYVRTQEFDDACERLGVVFDSKRGQLLLTPRLVQKLHIPVCAEICTFMETVLSQEKVNKVGHIYLVGGFANSGFVRDAVSSVAEKHNIEMFVPLAPQICVLKGACMFGHRSKEVASRVARYTYGKNIACVFDPAIHDPAYKKVFDGVEYCTKVFDTIIERGDVIKDGQTIKQTLWPVEDEQTQMFVKFFVLDRLPDAPVQYTTARDVVKLTTSILLEMPDTHKKNNRPVHTEFHFGGTEIRVTMVDEESGHTEAGVIKLEGDSVMDVDRDVTL